MTLNHGEWAAQQWAQVELGDRRLTRRAVAMGTQMAAHAEASLPEQTGSPSALKAVYWLLNHPGVSLAALTAPHQQHTVQAVRAVKVALLAEDTTDWISRRMPARPVWARSGMAEGAGCCCTARWRWSRRVAACWVWRMRKVVLRQPQAQRGPKWVRTPEGRVWEVSAAQVGAPPAGVCWVHVSDSGSDIFEFMAVCRQQQKHFLIRAFRNRCLIWPDDRAEATEPTAQAALDYVARLEPQLGSAYTVALPAEGQQPAKRIWRCNGPQSPWRRRCKHRRRSAATARSKSGWYGPGNSTHRQALSR